MTAHVAELRAFNRFFRRRVGALEDGLLGTRHPLPDARVLLDLAGPTEVRDLRESLGMDPGFLSRVLARLEGAGLVKREPSASDGRRQVAQLTEAGSAARADLDARSAAANGALLEGLHPATRDEIMRAMGVVRAALEPSGPIELCGPEPGDLGWIVARHGALYASEYGWDDRFERLVASVVCDHEAVWIATAGGTRAGCVMLVREEERTARLRLLLVEPWARGLGIGSQLIDACLDHARAAGYARVVLWTNDVLTEARRLYDRRGFVLVDEEPHARFGPPMTGQTLALDL